MSAPKRNFIKNTYTQRLISKDYIKYTDASYKLFGRLDAVRVIIIYVMSQDKRGYIFLFQVVCDRLCLLVSSLLNRISTFLYYLILKSS